jgi:hypothetical protein
MVIVEEGKYIRHVSMTATGKATRLPCDALPALNYDYPVTLGVSGLVKAIVEGPSRPSMSIPLVCQYKIRTAGAS